MAVSAKLIEEIKHIDDLIRDDRNSKRIKHNQVLLDIHEGNLQDYVDQSLAEELTPIAYRDARQRIAPINVLKKLIDKLSQCYSAPPVRVVYNLAGEEADQKDQDLWQWYESEMSVNEAGSTGNEYFNLFKNGAYEPFLDGIKPSLRVIPSDRFFVFSNDPVNPLRVTHFVKFMGNVRDDGKEKTLYLVYTAQETALFFSGGKIASDIMSARNMDGGNPYGIIPIVYFARSKVDLIPQIDTDTLSMTKLIPVLLTDLNYAVKYLSFGNIYTVDCEIDGVKAPNAIWQLKSDPTKDTKPEVGTIKPEVDTDKVLSLIRTELTLWMESRNIKPGAMGDISVQSAASGIAKAIDEMDTSADRKKQVPFLKTADEALANLILNHMHPVWMKVKGYPKAVVASKGCYVKSTFAEQRPLMDITQQINDQKMLIEAGLQSRRGALAELHPDWDDNQITQRLEEIDEEKEANIARAKSMMGNSGESQDDEEGQGQGEESETEAEAPAFAS